MTEHDLIEKSGYGAALRLEKIFPKRYAAVALTGLIIVVLFGIAGASFFESSRLLGLTLFFSGSFFLLLVYWLFVSFLQADSEHKQYDGNLKFTFFSISILSDACRRDKFYPQKFFKKLLSTKRFVWVLQRLFVSSSQFDELITSQYSVDYFIPLSDVYNSAAQKSRAANHVRIRYADILVALYEKDEVFRKIMFAFDVEEKDLFSVAYWQRRNEASITRQGKFWEEKNLLDIQGIGKHWSGGYTVLLDRLSADLSEKVKYKRPPGNLYGQRHNMEMLQRMLMQGANSGNVVLVGRPGSGRHSLLMAFTEAVNNGWVAGPLRYHRVLQIDSSAIISGTSSPNEVVAKVQQVFGEAYRSGNIILVVNDIDAFLDPSSEVGRINATEALLPYFESDLRVVGITTPEGYQTTIGKNSQLVKTFGKVDVHEPSSSETLLILQDEAVRLERRTGTFFSYFALLEIVKLTGKLIQNLPNPEKSLEVLEEAAVYAASHSKSPLIGVDDVQKIIESRTKVPVRQVAGSEKEILLHLEQVLHKRIIGQDVAISELANALRRARSGIGSQKRPIGTFLFLGPTGVGKTETVKALAGAYFGNEKRIIRFDMSEYQEIHGISRLIGNQDTGEGGQLTDSIVENPFSLILLDELEKAHPKILDLFLQVFDEGRLTDAMGRTVDFTNTMIIATSNAGAEKIRQLIKEGGDVLSARNELLDVLQSEGIFRPEFLNRFDSVIIFRPLSEDELIQVASLLLDELNQRLSEKDIQIKITPELAEAIARGGYSSEFGARPLRRYIQEKIENQIATGLISGDIKRGDEVEINLDEIQKQEFEN